MTVLAFVHGAVAMACAVAALRFVRFWQLTGDRLFVFFAFAFAVLAVHWLAIGLLNIPDEIRYSLYLPRLLAFALIIAGVVDKNRRAAP